MICKVRYLDGDNVVEEDADLPLTRASSVSQVMDAGRAFVDPKNTGLKPWERRFKLLSVKPSNLRVNGPTD